MIRDRSDGTLIDVRVTPRSSRNAIDGIVDGRVRVRLTAPPVDGSANDALIKFLASQFGVPRSSVEIVSGAHGRNKQVLLRGIDGTEAKARLEMIWKT